MEGGSKLQSPTLGDFLELLHVTQQLDNMDQQTWVSRHGLAHMG